MSIAQPNIASGFKRTDPAILNGHPLRGGLRDRVQREHLLRKDADPKRERIALIRDTVISVMGAVSALIPLVIAFQSVVGA